MCVIQDEHWCQAKLVCVAYVCPVYQFGRDYITTGDEFFVKLNHANDLQQLRELALKTKTKIIGENQFISSIYKIRVDKYSQGNPFELSQYFMQNGSFGFAQPNYNFSPTVTTDDPRFNRQWNLYNEGTPQQYNGTPGADMKVTEAWQITMGSSDIKVGILDSGVDTLHEDLIGDSVTLNSNLLPGYDACQDSAQNTKGYPTPNFDNDGHGTCCAGIACAIADNGLGIAGVAPNCKIVPVRVFYYITIGVGGNPIPWSTSEFFVNGISWQWQVADVDVSSNSWGITDNFLALFPGQDSIVNIAINEAVNSGRNGKGLPVLHSSGNDGITDTIPIWPARTAIVISVNTTSMCDEAKSATSCDNENWAGNWGNGLDVSAPGVKIPATDMNGTNGFSSSSNYYNTFNGTSAACPNAAGVMALILSVRPELTQAQARYILESTCDTVGGYDYSTAGPSGAWSERLGHGRINAKRAVEKARDYVIIQPSLEIDAYVYYNDTEQRSYLHYNVSNAGKVVIEWFDITGAKALLIDDDNHPAGGFNLLIDEPRHAAGIFVARLQLNQKEQMVKFFMPARKTE